MLHLITGTPGSGKTLYAVSLIVKHEDSNERALSYNAAAIKHNRDLIEKNDLAHYFSSYTYFNKKTKEQETVFFEDNHFDYLGSAVRLTDIFLDIQFYNGICKIIKNDLDLDLKMLRNVRHIYSNIDGLKVPNVFPIHVDWRKCPDGSIIFYDEIQLIPEYSTDNKKDEDGIIKSLTVHRHRAFDIYGITQFPSLVHTNYRAVVGLHYHLHRGWGAAAATCYLWANCREKPNSFGNKFTAERDFRFNYPKKLYDYYESATADTVKLRIPIKFLFILLIPIFGLIMFLSIIGKDSFLSSIFGHKEKQTSQSAASNNAATQNKQSQPTLSAVASNNQTQIDAAQPTVVQYDISKPYDQKVVVNYEVLNKPRLAGCIAFATQCSCYTQQATKIDMKDSDCKRYLSGDRPFDYFTVPTQHFSNNLAVNAKGEHLDDY